MESVKQLRPRYGSEIDFRYSARDLPETFHICCPYGSKLTKLCLPLLGSAFTRSIEINDPKEPSARTNLFHYTSR
jgi:hypothetical protein